MKKLLSAFLSIVLIAGLFPAYTSYAMEDNGYTPYYYNSWNFYEAEPDFNLAVGGTYEISYWSNLYNASYLKVVTKEGTSGNVISYDEGVIKGIGPGKVDLYFYDENYNILKDDTMENDYITITVRDIAADSTTKTVYVPYSKSGYYSTTVSVKLNKNITKSKSQIVCTDGSWYIDKIIFSKDTIYFNIYEKGTNTFHVNIEGKDFTFKFKLVPVKLSSTYLMAYKGKSHSTLKIKSPSSLKGVTFSSTNKKVATVSKKTGKVYYKGRGRCYIKAQKNGKTIAKCLVEVTYKKQYKAVKNAYKDLKANIKYSQGSRMSKGYRDCSSFVSRCYYDKSLGRKLVTIGPKSARTWALTAAGQAKWLNSHGKKVAKSQVSEKKLLPGDLVYYETGYAGTNSEWRSIDHAAIYVGNGLIMDTVTSLGLGEGTGTIDLRYYSDDSRVSFIGRPCK